MKRTLKILSLSILILFFGFFLIAEWWVETIFNDIINKNPERAYDVTYENLDLHTFLKGVTLESAKITPINVSDTATVINGKVSHIEMSGIRWRDFFFSRKAYIREMIFVNPDFDLQVVSKNKNDEKKKKSSKGMQDLFGDILSRGEVNNFKLVNGSAIARHRDDSSLVGMVKNFTLEASEIETDSVQAKSMIPFKVGRFSSSIDSAMVYLNEYTVLNVGYFAYQADNSELELNNASLSFTEDRLKVSDIIGEQVDLIEVDLKHLKISQIGAQSNLYTDLDIRAGTIAIDGLELKDFRDKNKERPPDAEKPMFKGMVASVPLPLKVDSILIRNSNVSYSELGEGKDESGTVQFSNINGQITRVTTIEEFQADYQSFKVAVTAELNQQADMKVKIEVPYDQESFNLHMAINRFDLDILNPTVMPLAGVEVSSGDIHKIDLKMNAQRTEASNVLMMDFDSLGLAVLKDHGHDYKRRGLISAIANGAIRSTNLPEHKHYQIAEYQSYRNIYRGPFNFMWATVKEGMLFLVPSGATGILLGDIEKKSKKKQQDQGKQKKKKN